MKAVIINLSISYDKYLLLYQGVAQNVFAHAIDGRSVQFPAKILRPYLLKNGIKGRFKIVFDDAGKYQFIEKLS